MRHLKSQHECLKGVIFESRNHFYLKKFIRRKDGLVKGFRSIQRAGSWCNSAVFPRCQNMETCCCREVLHMCRHQTTLGCKVFRSKDSIEKTVSQVVMSEDHYCCRWVRVLFFKFFLENIFYDMTLSHGSCLNECPRLEYVELWILSDRKSLC